MLPTSGRSAPPRSGQESLKSGLGKPQPCAPPQDANPAYTPEEIDRYAEAWSQPGAATGMINY